MKYEIQLDHPLPMGISMDTVEIGENTRILTTAFFKDTDGHDFFETLKTFERLFLGPFKSEGNNLSGIDNVLVLMVKNICTVYINECKFIINAIAQRNLSSGEPITRNDILGVRSLAIQNIIIPDDVGIILFFSIGWRRGLFFDCRPNSGANLHNIHQVMGRHYESLLYDDIQHLTENLWNSIFEVGWFPFLSLFGPREDKFKRLLLRAAEGKPIDIAENELLASFDEVALKEIETRLIKTKVFEPHMEIFATGLERYLSRDYVSCISTIWPRIEGILRYAYGLESNSRLKALLDGMRKELDEHSTVLSGIFLPQQFVDFLDKFYFRAFDLATGDTNVSRHSVGHGVADIADFSQKKALIGILIVDQLGYYVRLQMAEPNKST